VRIAEIYRSIQGEGLLTGAESAFVRTSGCNLRCWFCDTPYTSWAPEGEDWPLDQIVAEVSSLAVSHVVLTGGEPMLFAELIPLCQRLRKADCHVTIETAGTLYLPVHCDLMSISPKLASSTPSVERAGNWAARHERTRHAPDIVRRLMDEFPWQLKFVVDSPEDCREVDQYLAEFPQLDRSRVLLMPQGIDLAELKAKEEWLAPYCRQHGLVFCPRKHIEWFGAVRGT
jgi:7-carboxy-7-deazaguanine synthase